MLRAWTLSVGDGQKVLRFDARHAECLERRKTKRVERGAKLKLDLFPQDLANWRERAHVMDELDRSFYVGAGAEIDFFLAWTVDSRVSCGTRERPKRVRIWPRARKGSRRTLAPSKLFEF